MPRFHPSSSTPDVIPSWNGRSYFLRPPLLFQTGQRDVQASKNVSCSHKKGRFSHLPGGCFWAAAMGITESSATFQRVPRHDDFTRASGEGPPLARNLPRPLPWHRDPLPRPPSPPAHGAVPLGRPTSAALATSNSRSPAPRAPVPAPRRERIVVVCLCLLKLGREKRPPSQDGLECAAERCADGSVSKLRKRAGRPGTRPRSGPARPGARCRRGRGRAAAPGQRSLLCRCQPALSRVAA